VVAGWAGKFVSGHVGFLSCTSSCVHLYASLLVTGPTLTPLWPYLHLCVQDCQMQAAKLFSTPYSPSSVLPPVVLSNS
jgi:hypothetical protein